MIKIKFARSYKPKGGNGKVTFVYHVFGSPDELKTFETIQGQYYRDDVTPSGSIPVWFSPRFVGEECTLIVTKGETPRLVADTSEFDKANSLVSQYGGNLGTEIAKVFASKLTGHTPAQAQPTVAKEPTPEPNS